MPRYLPSVVAVALLGTASLALGCGGSSDPLSAAELIARGDRVCTTEQERFAEIQTPPPAGGDEAAAQSGDLADAAGEELGDLEDLTPPATLDSAYEDYLDSLREAKELIERGEDAASGQDAAGYGKAQSELAAGAAKREKLARAVGFKACSKL